MQNQKPTGTKQPGLTYRQEQLIHALLTEKSVNAAAKAAKCATRTAHYWLKQPHFQEAYRAARHDVVSGAASRLQAASTEAVEALRTVIADTSVPAYSRVAAARFIVDAALRARELEEIEVSLEVLERRLDEREAQDRARHNR
jgi:hypothetical protein